jgi:thiamine-monophosphate kinase
VMNRNLSDCAAMACLPAAALATVALPRGRDIEYAKQLFLGMKAAADAFDFPVVGGDTGSWDGKLAMTVTILGRSDGIDPVRRSGAKVGDGIYVTGPLGGSILGRHLSFTPRIALARTLAKDGATSMIDLSDGLSRDLRHICRESHVGAIIEAHNIPVHEDAIQAGRDGRSPLEHALHDGEDYELLFTSARISPANRIGVVTEEPDIVLKYRDGRSEPLQPKGWEHRL